MRAKVLAFGWDGRELSILKTVCTRLDIRLRRVAAEEYGQPVGAFFDLEARTEDAGAAGDIPERMLVLGGFTSRQMDAFLSALRTARAGGSLKAVLTQSNARWTAPTLYAELAKERAAMEAK